MWQLKKRLSTDRGQASVELFASLLVVVTTLLFVVQIILYVYSYVVLAEAAKEGVRYAVVHGSANSSTTNVAAQVSKFASYSSLNVCYIKDTDSTTCCAV